MCEIDSNAVLIKVTVGKIQNFCKKLMINKPNLERRTVE
jgi:hypothetical protein